MGKEIVNNSPMVEEIEQEPEPDTQKILEGGIEGRIMSNFCENKFLNWLKELPRKLFNIISKKSWSNQ